MPAGDPNTNESQNNEGEEQTQEEKPDLESITEDAKEDFDQEDAKSKANESEEDDDTEDEDSGVEDNNTNQEGQDDLEDEEGDDESEDDDDEDDTDSEDTDEEDTEEDDERKNQPNKRSDETLAEGPQVDSDITKPGDYKVEFTDSEGNKYYVHDASDLPDDFEPRTYKEFAVASQKLPYAQAAFSRDKHEFEQGVKKSEAVQRQEAISKNWQGDIKNLQNSGHLPKKSGALKKEVNKVFDYMGDQLKEYQKSGGKKGAILDNFSVAYRNMKYEEMEAEKANQEQTTKENKSKRGAMIGGSTNNNRSNKNIIAPPSGMSLDDLHESVTDSLS